jgi:chaperonin GroEL
MGKRIEFDDAARQALRRGVDQLAGAVRVTLGPRGRHVVIERKAGTPAITNDGLAIAREIELAKPFENMGVQLIREVATKTGEVAGDGTTTATVLAHAIVAQGLRAITSGANPMALKRGIDRAVTAAVAELGRQATPVKSDDDIARIATVSAQNDPRVGELIAEAIRKVGRHGVVTVEEGRGMETTLEVVEGMRLDRGYLSPYFVTDPETMSTELDDALVLLTETRISAVRALLPAMEHAARMGRPLLVMAEDVEGEALATLVVNRLRGTVASVAVRAPEVGDHRREILGDLATLSGARLYSPETGGSLEKIDPGDFGRAKRVLVDRDTTTVVEGGGGQQDIRNRIAALERELAGSDHDFERERLRARLSRLTGGIGVIHVGAATEPELHERRSRIEDALAATRAAVEEGIVTGGGVALLRTEAAVSALELKGDESIGRDIVLRALEEPARQIAINAGADGAVAVERIRRGSGAFGFDALTVSYVDLDRQGIVDAAKVVRCALQHAASIGSLVLTTDAIVVDSDDGSAPAEE